MRVAQMIKNPESEMESGGGMEQLWSAKFLENVSRESESRTWTWSVFRRDWNSQKDASLESLGDL